MKINDMEIPNYLIKVCEKQEYADQLMSGKLYMKSSGYFRKLEDGYRGDIYDGRKPLDVGDKEIYLESEEGERLFLNGVPGAKIENLSWGFENDDKVPIFCACMMNEDTIEITGSNSFRIKKEYLDELQKFGQYAVLIPLGELMKKLDEYVREVNEKVIFHTDKVKYVDILKKYSPDDFNYRSWETDIEAFFTKDKAYKMQNEWRILAYADDVLIEEDCWKPDIKPFQYAVQMKMKNLVNGEFHFEETEE